ncbi:type IV secretion system protein [Paraburkholderia azotifigens]|uniref:Type IV secretion system protein n=1 Tax=Paraburkholderia azotifigens TaxID=2057004 RepID=A0A5C6VP81_9BURK|nr:type IV secretion system protein [Paraburkholderia azotifigens]TXC85555.1 type IV secretion system protein [Paraburkholderia azotifigens]
MTSRKRAWQVSASAIGFGFLSLAWQASSSGVTASPIPEHMLVMDPKTGAVQQVSLMPDETTSYGEVVDSYWIAQFVIHHEGYEFYSAQADYDFIGLTATGEVADRYQKLWNGADAPDKKLGDTEMTRVNVSSAFSIATTASRRCVTPQPESIVPVRAMSRRNTGSRRLRTGTQPGP